MAQCFDALNTICHTQSRMVLFKNKNVRGQRDGMHLRLVIDRVHERARAQALKFTWLKRQHMHYVGAGLGRKYSRF